MSAKLQPTVHHKDVYMVALRDGSGRLIGYYEKHEDRTCESERGC